MLEIELLRPTNLGQQEALREQHDLTDLLQVGHDDHHGTEQGLYRLWQLCAAGVPGVHGDEDANTEVNVDLDTLKLQAGKRKR